MAKRSSYTSRNTKKKKARELKWQGLKSPVITPEEEENTRRLQEFFKWVTRLTGDPKWWTEVDAFIKEK